MPFIISGSRYGFVRLAELHGQDVCPMVVVEVKLEGSQLSKHLSASRFPQFRLARLVAAHIRLGLVLLRFSMHLSCWSVFLGLALD